MNQEAPKSNNNRLLQAEKVYLVVITWYPKITLKFHKEYTKSLSNKNQNQDLGRTEMSCKSAQCAQT